MTTVAPSSPRTTHGPPQTVGLGAHTSLVRRWRCSIAGALTALVMTVLVPIVVPIVVPALVKASPTGSGYSAPIAPRPTVVRGFDDPPQRWQPGHRGVDLAATPGAPVLAAAEGVVRFAGVVAGKPTVSISHDDGVITTYEPVRASVARGVRVLRGEHIGTLEPGHPGCVASACLHWGARRSSGRDAQYLDPLRLLGAVRVRLKPVGELPWQS